MAKLLRATITTDPYPLSPRLEPAETGAGEARPAGPEESRRALCHGARCPDGHSAAAPREARAGCAERLRWLRTEKRPLGSGGIGAAFSVGCFREASALCSRTGRPALISVKIKGPWGKTVMGHDQTLISIKWKLDSSCPSGTSPGGRNVCGREPGRPLHVLGRGTRKRPRRAGTR